MAGNGRQSDDDAECRARETPLPLQPHSEDEFLKRKWKNVMCCYLPARHYPPPHHNDTWEIVLSILWRIVQIKPFKADACLPGRLTAPRFFFFESFNHEETQNLSLQWSSVKHTCQQVLRSLREATTDRHQNLENQQLLLNPIVISDFSGCRRVDDLMNSAGS